MRIFEKKRHQLLRIMLPQLCKQHSLLPIAATAANKTKPLQGYIMYKVDSANTRIVLLSECLTYIVINYFVVHVLFYMSSRGLFSEYIIVLGDTLRVVWLLLGPFIE